MRIRAGGGGVDTGRAFSVGSVEGQGKAGPAGAARLDGGGYTAEPPGSRSCLSRWVFLDSPVMTIVMAIELRTSEGSRAHQTRHLPRRKASCANFGSIQSAAGVGGVRGGSLFATEQRAGLGGWPGLQGTVNNRGASLQG